MNLEQLHNVYFIGIGGIGMSALARYFKTEKEVAGYDKTKTKLTENLQKTGIDIHYKDAISNIPNAFKNPKNTLVVYTPAIPKSNNELNYFKTHNYFILKRSEVLGIITQNTYCFAVAGTHGKTTTTSILGHILYQCNVPVTAFLGGISENYHSNYISKGTQVTVVEADEFDRSFLTLQPNIACITAMDADHLDIYKTKNELEASFLKFTKKLKPNGTLFIKKGLPIKGKTFAINNEADYTINNITIENATYTFSINTPKETIKNIVFHLPGKHNLSNALAAFAMAYEYGCKVNEIKNALASYTGVERRFTFQIKSKDFVFIDDYAHHPEEINAVFNTLKELYPNKKITAVFQPHLYSRTQDFADEFATSLAAFNEIILLPIYPAREEAIPGVTSKWLLDKIKNKNKKLVPKKDLIAILKKQNPEVLVTIGAGDIGEEVSTIKKAFTNET